MSQPRIHVTLYAEDPAQHARTIAYLEVNANEIPDEVTAIEYGRELNVTLHVELPGQDDAVFRLLPLQEPLN